MALDLWDTGVDVRLILPGAIATEIWDQPGNDARSTTAPSSRPRTSPAGIIAAIEGDAFEHYLPDMKAHRDVQDRRRWTGVVSPARSTSPRPSARARTGA